MAVSQAVTRAAVACAGIVLCVLVVVAHGKPITTRRTGDLRAARDAGSDGLVILSDENFTAFAMEGPRPYGMAIMFTAQAAKYNCKHCRAAEDKLQHIASSYLREGDAAPPLFFAIADFPVNHGAYQAYGFRMAPVLVVRPVEKFRNSIPKPQDWKDTRTQFGVVRPTNSVDELASFITNVTGIPVQVYHDPEPRFGVAVVVAVLSGMVAAWLAVHPSWLCFCYKRRCWLAGSLAVYFVSVSGMVLCIMHRPFWYYASPDVKHKFHLFSGESRSQFVVEGLIIGSLNMLCAASVVVLLAASKRQLSTATHLVAAAGCVAVFASAYTFIVETYGEKTRWYSIGGVVSGYRYWVESVWYAIKTVAAKRLFA